METGITLLCGAAIQNEWIFKPIVQMTGRGRTVLVVDGENSFRSYWIARYAREMGLDPRTALEYVKLSRAFTCYQLAELITQKVAPLAHAGCAGIVCLGLLATLNDEDISLSEAGRLLSNITAALKTLARSCPILITIRLPSRRADPRLGLVHALMRQVDKAYVIEPGAAPRIKTEADEPTLAPPAGVGANQLALAPMLDDKCVKGNKR